MNAEAICDGRGNAGTGARAAILHIGDTGEIFERAEQITPTTNIVAEHLAIQLSIELALEHDVTNLVIFNDSQVPVYQVQGSYGIKQPHLRPIVYKTWDLASQLESVEIIWTPRENTKAADLLCRQVDRPKPRLPRPLPVRSRSQR